MFESGRFKTWISVNRGTNFGTSYFETETTLRTPPSDEGWCVLFGLLAWWDGKKGIAIALQFGDPGLFSQSLGKGAGYKNLSKYQLPRFDLLNEISSENNYLGYNHCDWTITEPILRESLVITVSIHKNWYHLYHTQHKGKVLGAVPTLELGSVATDRKILSSLVDGILG